MAKLRASIRTLFVVSFMFLFVFLVPLFTFPFDVATILSVISLLFAILVGFFFAAVTSNYLSMQALIPEEDSVLMSIYNHAALIDPKKAKKMAEAVDAYMIKVLDYDILTYAPHVREELLKITDVIDEVQPSDDRGKALIQNLHNFKAKLIEINQKTVLVAQSVLSPAHWSIIVLLSVLIDALLLGLRTTDPISSVFIAILFITPYLILNLLHEVDSNLFLAKHLAYESPQNVFMSIGKLPYYPETILNAGVVKNPKTPYRVGVYLDLASSLKKKIKTIRQ